MANETDASKQSDLKLDLFNGEGEPASNKFDLSDVKLVDLTRNSIDNNEEESFFHEITADELVIESNVVKSDISADTFDSKAVADEVGSSETSDKDFKEYVEQRGLSSNQEEYENTFILEGDDDDDAKEEEIPEEMTRTMVRMVKRFTIESDIEKIDEEMDETETSVNEEFQRSERVKIALTSATEMLSTEALLVQAKSKLIFRAASMLEQRLRTISALKNVFEERRKLGFKNRFLNDKCCEYMKKIMTDHNFESIDGALPIHGNQKYYNILEKFMGMKIYFNDTKNSLEQETQNLTDSYYICRTSFDQVYEVFISRETEVGLECIDGKAGKLPNQQKLQSMIKKQQRRFNQLAEVRVHYLKLHNQLVSIYKNLDASNLMSEGHTLMEYEQLVIVNHAFMDKLDDREEELRKLRNQCIEDVVSLSHMKETCDAFAHDTINATMELEEVTKKKNKARYLLAVQRLKKNLLRKNTLKIHSATDLFTSPRLLRKMATDSYALNVLKRNINISRQASL